MEEIPTDNSIDYQAFINNKEAGLHSLIKQNFIIRKISYNNNTLTLQSDYNNSIVFNGITEDIYNYQIGSYKVIDKWLKYRKADNVILTEEDINHIIHMAIVIKNTIKLQKDISELLLPS